MFHLSSIDVTRSTLVFIIVQELLKFLKTDVAIAIKIN
jgi:hypothetical protein